MCRTVANRLTPVNFAYLQDPALQLHDLVHRVGAAGLWVDAIQRGAGAHEVEVEIRSEKDAGGRGETGGEIRQTPSRRSKALVLDVVQRMRWFVRAGEMADEGAPSDRVRPRQFVCKSIELGDGQAKAGHSGIEMQHCRPFAVAGGGASPIGNLPWIVE